MVQATLAQPLCQARVVQCRVRWAQASLVKAEHVVTSNRVAGVRFRGPQVPGNVAGQHQCKKVAQTLCRVGQVGSKFRVGQALSTVTTALIGLVCSRVRPSQSRVA